MRSEEFERIRRNAEIQHAAMSPADRDQFVFKPELPWDGVFALAVKAREFWDEEVRQKSILQLTRIKTSQEVMHDGTVQPNLHHAPVQPPAVPASPGAPRRTPRRAKKQKLGKGNQQQPRQPLTDDQKASRANEVCANFNQGRCQTPCAHGRKHVCSVCGSPKHGAHENVCRQGGGGAGKGKGKSKQK